MSQSAKSPEHDVIIVGTSIAGCRTALTLADRGVRALLLDRAEFPRWKPCAGGITLKARPYIPDPLFDLVETTVRGTHFTFGEEYATHLRADDALGWTIHRETFDQAHLELAESRPTVDAMLGTTVREVREDDSGVRVRTDSGELTARVLVGADGAMSVVSRHLPGHDERPMGFAYEGEAKAAAKQLVDDTLFDFRKFPRGYGWVFPKEDHYSVGGFVYKGSLPGVKELYEEFCAETPCLKGAETYRARGHPVALGGEMRRLNTKRILLAGEAGNLVDPLTGEGIYYALRSGHLAGEAVADFLENRRSLDVYGDQVRDEIQENLRYGRFVAGWVYRHPKAGYHLLLRNSLLCRWFAEAGVGARTYKELFVDVLKKGFLLPFHSGLPTQKDVVVKM
jgi:geranylgeranyl reductase family protein